jgi:hypothetical protein
MAAGAVYGGRRGMSDHHTPVLFCFRPLRAGTGRGFATAIGDPLGGTRFRATPKRIDLGLHWLLKIYSLIKKIKQIEIPVKTGD